MSFQPTLFSRDAFWDLRQACRQRPLDDTAKQLITTLMRGHGVGSIRVGALVFECPRGVLTITECWLHDVLPAQPSQEPSYAKQ